MNGKKVTVIVGEFDWSSFDYGVMRKDAVDRRAAAARLEASLGVMLTALTNADAESAYFAGVENTAFVSGMVFGVSASVTDCILAAWPLATSSGHRWGLAALQQIACGADAGSLSTEPLTRTVEYCHSKLREHLAMLYEALGQDVLRWSAAKILTAVELDGTRLSERFSALLNTERDAFVRQALEDGLRRN